MGIPSFYKHLIQTIAGITAKTRRAPPEVFALDLNCAIYHCIKKVQKTTPYSETIHTKWEADLHSHVIAYIKQLVRNVAPSKNIYIAVDGVAPMAKIKQQRARRFKSAQAAEQEARIKAEARNTAYVPTPRWDSNAITPGTRFMAGLTTALRAYAATNPSKIIVSPADEPGEGEQKIMMWARTHTPSSMVVYGLDADLIVLALWMSATSKTAVDLYREEVEFNGAVKVDATEEEQYLYMDVQALAKALHATHGRMGQAQDEFSRDFVALMNLLGNDFVPHGMALKIRDDGVQRLCEIQNSLTTPVVEQNTTGEWHYDVEALKKIFSALAGDEDKCMLRNIRKKLEARPGASGGKNPEEHAMSLYNDLPVTWAAESVLVNKVVVPGAENPQTFLKSDYATIYDKVALWGTSAEKAAEIYLQTLAWTLAYYSGAQIDNYWYYPWLLPPRHASILKVLEGKSNLVVPATARTPLKPIEQLAMVLPQTSFTLLPKEYNRLLTIYPVYWPLSWGIYSFGRRFLWECEPLIPLILPSEIKNMIEAALDD
jgi:5'-3' exonuclease